MARKTPKDKVIDALIDYFALKDSNPTSLAMGILNTPGEVQEGMFTVAMDILFEVSDRGLNSHYTHNPQMEGNSITARKMIDRL